MGRKAEFETNEDMERLHQIREKQPETYRSLSPVTKIALAHYLNDKKSNELAQVNKGAEKNEPDNN